MFSWWTFLRGGHKKPKGRTQFPKTRNLGKNKKWKKNNILKKSKEKSFGSKFQKKQKIKNLIGVLVISEKKWPKNKNFHG